MQVRIFIWWVIAWEPYGGKGTAGMTPMCARLVSRKEDGLLQEIRTCEWVVLLGRLGPPNGVTPLHSMLSRDWKSKHKPPGPLAPSPPRLVACSPSQCCGISLVDTNVQVFFGAAVELQQDHPRKTTSRRWSCGDLGAKCCTMWQAVVTDSVEFSWPRLRSNPSLALLRARPREHWQAG